MRAPFEVALLPPLTRYPCALPPWVQTPPRRSPYRLYAVGFRVQPSPTPSGITWIVLASSEVLLSKLRGPTPAISPRRMGLALAKSYTMAASHCLLFMTWLAATAALSPRVLSIASQSLSSTMTPPWERGSQ